MWGGRKEEGGLELEERHREKIERIYADYYIEKLQTQIWMDYK
jgi:hypothetical protein